MSLSEKKLCCPEDRLMEVNLACVEELRKDIQGIRERIAEQVSESERSLQKYIQFELLKAQGYLKNVSEKLAQHIEQRGCTDGEDRQKFKDTPVKRREDSPTHSPPAWAGNPFHRSDGDETSPEAKAAQLDSSKHTKPQQPTQKPTEGNGCLSTSKKISKCDDIRRKCRDRSVEEGSNQPPKFTGKSLLPKCIENGQTPKVYLNGKTSQWYQPSPVNQEGTQQSFALEHRAGEADKMTGRQNNSKRQDRDRQQQNHFAPKSREYPKQHSLSTESGFRERGNLPKFATVRLPLTINRSNNMNYTNVKTRFMRRHQDDEVRALFGL